MLGVVEVYGVWGGWSSGGVGRGHLNRGREETTFIMGIGLKCIYII